MSTYNKIFLTGLLAVLGVCLATQNAYAYQVDTLQSVPSQRDFVVGPGKEEITINPGEKKTVFITVTNRMGDDREFNLATEDFTGSSDPKTTVVLLGNDHGPYSLKDYIKPEVTKLDLKQGQRATIAVTISIPSDAQPGGRYGSILTSTVSKASTVATKDVAGGAAIISRIGTLFFVRIPGAVKEEGSVKEFSTTNHKSLFTSGPIPMQILFQNDGSMYLSPYGQIHVKNMFGSEVGSADIDPWFSMPNSLRLREISWDKGFLFGRYVATVDINRGYGDIIDHKSVVFWVIPIKVIIAVFVGIIALFVLVRFIASKFEIRMK